MMHSPKLTKRILAAFAACAFFIGVGAIAAGSWGIVYTYESIAKENIVTPDDAAIAGKQVRGPLTLKAQADVIYKHTLARTNGKAYADMPRTVPKLDESGNPALDENGEPIMIPNEARNLWITAMTLRTALQLGLMAYMLGAFAVLFGLISIATGVVFLFLRKRFECANETPRPYGRGLFRPSIRLGASLLSACRTRYMDQTIRQDLW